MENSWIVAVLLAALASFISNLGVTLQKLHHVRQAEEELYSRSHPVVPNTPSVLNRSQSSNQDSQSVPPPDPPPPQLKKGYVHAVLWRTGLGLVIFGSIADFAALSFGPQSLVAPLGSLTLVSNVIFAPLLLKEQVSRHDIGSTTLIILGSSISVAFGSHEAAVYTVQELFSFYSRPTFVVYALFISIFMLLLFLAIKHIEHVETEDNQSPAYLRLRGFHRFLYPTISGTVGAQSVLFAKCSVELLSNTFAGRDFSFYYPQTYIVLGCMFSTIFLQIKWLNEGLSRFDATYCVPVFTSFWITLSVISGMIFYKEYTGMSDFGTFMFVIGVLITITGVAALSQRDHKTPASIHMKGESTQATESGSVSPIPTTTASVMASAANHARDGVFIAVDRTLHSSAYDDDDLDVDIDDSTTNAIHIPHDTEREALINVSQALKNGMTSIQINGMNGHANDVLWDATHGGTHGTRHHRTSSLTQSHVPNSPLPNNPDSQALLRKSSLKI